ncbi:hypothetical protein CPB85DRAFT_137882 [Mucidula mucida]|nr:hypothetical protein CPB85DRAFT_137882 [Mucidula mucida]
MFSSLQLTDDDGLLGSAVSNELGEIRVEHWHVMLGAPLPFTPTAYTDTGIVHERSKKAVSHRTRLGAPKITSLQTQRGATRVARLLTVIFRYRPLEMLRANGIAPPPLQQHSGSKKRARSPDADISDDDSEDESARIAKLEAELERLRSGKKSNKRVKREQEVKQEKIVLDPNDIVDVT